MKPNNDTKQLEHDLAQHGPLICGSLEFRNVGGDIKITRSSADADENQADLLPAKDAERLCCWLTLVFPGVRQYIKTLKQERDEAVVSYVRLSTNLPVSDGILDLLKGPTLGERIRQAIASHRTHKEGCHDGSQTWLANKINVPLMTVYRYVLDQAIPVPNIAARIATVLGWPKEEMARYIRAAKIQHAMKKELHAKKPKP
ncbi:MAG: hypothetical protein WC455_18110 [Dehalococcoidia bacterium]|jgi:hypothetical protein